MTTIGINVTVSGPASGLLLDDLLFMHILIDLANGDDGAITNWTNMKNLAGTVSASTSLASRNGDNMLLAHYLARYTGSGTPTFTIQGGTLGADVYARMYAFRDVNLGTTAAEVYEAEAFATGTSTTIADVGITTTGPDRLAIQLVGVNDDNAVGPFTGMTGGTWVEATAEYLTATGTDACLQLQTAAMAAAGTIDGGTYVMAISDSWAVTGFALKPQDSSPPRHSAMDHNHALV